MGRYFGTSLLIVLLVASNAFGGLGKYGSPYSSDSIIAPILIQGKGLYNLVISIKFLNEPYDKGRYKSDEYENFIRRLEVEWSGVALSQILKAKEQTVNDLVVLKGNIEGAITKLADQLKDKYRLDKNIEVVFALSNFFLLEPTDN